MESGHCKLTTATHKTRNVCVVNNVSFSSCCCCCCCLTGFLHSCTIENGECNTEICRQNWSNFLIFFLIFYNCSKSKLTLSLQSFFKQLCSVELIDVRLLSSLVVWAPNQMVTVITGVLLPQYQAVLDSHKPGFI